MIEKVFKWTCDYCKAQEFTSDGKAAHGTWIRIVENDQYGEPEREYHFCQPEHLAEWEKINPDFVFDRLVTVYSLVKLK